MSTDDMQPPPTGVASEPNADPQQKTMEEDAHLAPPAIASQESFSSLINYNPLEPAETRQSTPDTVVPDWSIKEVSYGRFKPISSCDSCTSVPEK
jgi:hypothetical protein